MSGRNASTAVNAESETENEESSASVRSPRRIRRWIRRLTKTLLALILLYAGFVIIGLIPINNDFQPAEDGITVFVSSNPVHADVILPLTTDVIDWRKDFPPSCFRGDTSAATHVAIGWGERGFFLKTPTWADLKLSTAANALLWPSDTCIHVTMKSNVRTNSNVRSVSLTSEQYGQLVTFIRSSLAEKEGLIRQIPSAAYNQNDAFFEAVGSYHCCNTCNSWVGNALDAADVRVGLATPLPKTVFLYLPDAD